VKNDISVEKAIRYAMSQNVTMLGIGPMSLNIIKASTELAHELDFPLMFIASRNQVDKDRFGSGYANNWNQERFVDDIMRVVHNTGYTGLTYICRDHGGQWQRDTEKARRLPYDEATRNAYESFTADIHAGFDLLHIDPTKDPHNCSVSLAEVIDRVVATLEYTEHHKPESMRLAYEIGTEENSGGAILLGDFEHFIQSLYKKIELLNLPKPCFIVGQTGTLVKMTRNAGRFDDSKTGELSGIARKYGIGFKEHNADYLPLNELLMHPIAGITAANVAPEFGVEETRALLKLGRQVDSSEFSELLERHVLTGDKWIKWLDREHAGIDVRAVIAEPKLRREIAEIAGHYYFNDPEIKDAKQALYAFAKRHGVEDPEKQIRNDIKKAIVKYINAFNLSGFTAKLRQNVKLTSDRQNR
jgi:hypothetical protein